MKYNWANTNFSFSLLTLEVSWELLWLRMLGGSFQMRPGPLGSGRDWQNTARTAGMQSRGGQDHRDGAGTTGTGPGPLGRHRDAAELQAGSGLTQIESQNKSWVANGGQAGGQRRPVSLRAAGRTGGQERPKAARNVRRRPGTSKGSQERPKAARKVQRRTGMSAVSAVVS